MNRDEAKAKAIQLKNDGMKLAEIGKELGNLGFKNQHGTKGLSAAGVSSLIVGSTKAVPAVSYERVPPLPPPPPADHVMVIIARPEQLNAITKGFLK